MEQPCLACGKTFHTQRSLSGHRSRCLQNKALKLSDILHCAIKRHKSNDGRRSKRPRIEQEEVMQEARDGEARAMDDSGMDVDDDTAAVNQVCFVWIVRAKSYSALTNSRILVIHQMYLQPLRSHQNVLDALFACHVDSLTISRAHVHTLHTCLQLFNSDMQAFRVMRTKLPKAAVLRHPSHHHHPLIYLILPSLYPSKHNRIRSVCTAYIQCVPLWPQKLTAH